MRRATVLLLSTIMLLNIVQVQAPASASQLGLIAPRVVGAPYSGAMYAPAPRFPYGYRPAMPLPDLRSYRNASGVARYGNRMQVSLRGTGFDPHHIPIDRLALRPSTTGVRRFAFSSRGSHIGYRMRTFDTPTSSPDIHDTCFTCVMTPRPIMTPTPAPTAAPTAAPIPTPTPQPTVPSNPAATGINPWWTFQTSTVAGVGGAMVNMGNGNFLLQAQDFDITERGVDLAFVRSFNSMSGHDANGSDGSGPSVFGNRWTNTLDAHLAYNSGANVMTVYDDDGASYTYTANAGAWVAPAGQHAQLSFDGGCGYYWTKTTGETYHFYAPFATSCAYPGGTYGRLSQIFYRNYNSVINLTYSWSGSGSSLEQLTQIIAAHTDGHLITLNFSSFGSYTELSQLSRPDGSQVTYSYDTQGNLLEVDRPGNPTTPSLPETYSYVTSGSAPSMSIYSPRATLASRAGSQDGAYYTMQFDSSNHAASAWTTGLFNPTPSDGTSTALQSGAAWVTINSQSFSGFGTSSTSFTESTGHADTYGVDSLGRIAQHRAWTGSQWLVSTDTWDQYNNLTETIDARGNPTDMAYDANGNIIAVALPSVSTSQGTLRPTSLYSYDDYNNIVASCDPNYVASVGRSWTSPPTVSDSLCPSASGATRYTYVYPVYQPYGELTVHTTPVGNTLTYTYPTSSASDFGQPLTEAGVATAQRDGTTITPKNTYAYDSYGNTISINAGDGTATETYDGLNRLATKTDPDNVVEQSTVYSPDDTIKSSQNYAERAAGVQRTYSYDADENEISHTDCFGYTTSSPSCHQTLNWYDGDDRLVEVQLPADPSVDNGLPGLTRYIYDLSSGSTSVSFGGRTYVHAQSEPAAYGGNYKTQQYFNLSSATATSGQTWNDVVGTLYDGLDRPTNTLRFVAGISGPQNTTFNYDSSANTLGFLSSKTNAVNETSTYTYDADGRTSGITFAGDGGVTPAESLTYDAFGNVAKAAIAGIGTEVHSYDADEQLTQVVEPSGYGESAPATLSYAYYSDGDRASISVAAAPAPFSGAKTLVNYSYRVDGQLQTLQSPLYSQTLSYQYTNAGRRTVRSDSATGSTVGSALKVVSDSLAYSNGLVSSHTFPNGGRESAFTYDGEGEVTGYAITAAPYTPTTCGARPTPFSCVLPSAASYRYSARANLADTKAIGSWDNPSSTIRGFNPGISNCYSSTDCSYDTTTGAALETSSAPGPCDAGIDLDVVTYKYDAAGRRSSTTATATNPKCTVGEPPSATYAFDARDRMLNVGSTKLVWGPGGHPIEATAESFTNTTGPVTLHWDGDALLFVTNTSGALLQMNLGNDEILGQTSSGLNPTASISSGTLLSRDASGTIVLSYNSSNMSQWLAVSGSPSSSSYGPPPIADTASNLIITQVAQNRLDGYSIGSLTVQGQRLYDSGVGEFISTDSYAGSVTKPSSQLSYMWNNNNPIMMQDPSGNDPTDASNGSPIGGGGQDNVLKLNWRPCPGIKDCGEVTKYVNPGPTPEQLARMLSAFNGPGTPTNRPPHIMAAAADAALFAEDPIHVHHWLPQAFRAFFRSKGLDIEKYTSKMPRSLHIGKETGLHSGTGMERYNVRWAEFIKTDPTKEQILQRLNEESGGMFLTEDPNE